MGIVARRVLRAIARYPELAAVVVAAATGLALPSPMRWVANRDGIEALLAILVFATGITIDPRELSHLRTARRSLAVSVVTGITVLPALAWTVARLVPSGPLRDGVLAAGVAPCEIASVATTAMAGGAVALAAGVLAGSTLASVVLAGPILTLQGGSAAVHTSSVIVQLILVVAVPLTAGLAARRAMFPAAARIHRAAARTATGAVTALVALVAGEAHVTIRYLAVGGAFVLFLLGSGIAGRAITRITGEGLAVGRAVLLTTSMRDFAVAAALATAAWGPAAAAPLGLYGIMVLAWGTGAAGFLRSHRASGPTLRANAATDKVICMDLAPSDLQRFVDAQDAGGIYARAIAELRSGRKASHWMWFVFPQIDGLGRSPTARHFAIRSLEEARAYLRHPVLGPRLRESAMAAAEAPASSAGDLLGEIDAMKLRSSMTLFLRSDPDGPWQSVLDRWFGGEPDPATDALLADDP